MYSVFEKLLEEKGVTAYRVSVETGIGRSTFTDWKNGRSNPKGEKLRKIADYFGVTVDYLQTGEEKELSLPAQMDLWNSARADKELLRIMQEYLKMNDNEKKHIIEAVNFICEAKDKK